MMLRGSFPSVICMLNDADVFNKGWRGNFDGTVADNVRLLRLST